MALTSLALLATGSLRAEEFRAGIDRPVPLEQKPAARGHPSAATARLDDTTATVLGYLRDYEWEKHTEIRSGNVISLRRSTDMPSAKNEIVILRWRTPAEFARQDGVSSKGLSPAALRLQLARLKN